MFKLSFVGEIVFCDGWGFFPYSTHIHTHTSTPWEGFVLIAFAKVENA